MRSHLVSPPGTAYNHADPHGSTGGAQQHWLRKREKQALSDMIQKAVPLDSQGKPVVEVFSTAAASSPDLVATTWRLLIFDDWGRDIIAPLLKVGQLRELGVTLYLHIAAAREPVPGAPAVYLCAPTEANVARIAEDCANSLYEWVYINFTQQAPRQLLESLAQKLIASPLQSIRHIRLLDRTLSYVALEDDLFSLLLNHSFEILNKTNAREEEISSHLNQVVLGIMDVCLTMQVLPVLVHQRSGATEEVARRLALRLNDALNERLLAPAPSSVFGRPLLLLMDRSSDIATALHHPFTYRGLLADAAGMRLNKCVITTADGTEETMEVDPEKDEVYCENAGQDFSAVGGNIEAALRRYKTEYAELAQDAALSGMEANSTANNVGGNDMSRLLASAPLLAERKRFLDAHTKLAYTILNKIRQQHLDHFHGVETAMLHQDDLDKEEFSNLLKNRTGTLSDRQRLYLIAYLMCTGDEESRMVQRHAEDLNEAPFPALAYLQHLRQWSLSTRGSAAAASNTTDGFGWGFAQQIAKNIATSLGTKSDTMLPVTKLVDALLQDNGAAGSPTMMPYGGGGGGGGGGPTGTSANSLRRKLLDTVTAYDPRTKKAVDLNEAQFSQVIVFALGGGSLSEYDNLKQWEAAKSRKSVMYGCTSLISGDDMLHELASLGEALSS